MSHDEYGQSTRTQSARQARPIEPCDPDELRILKGLLSSKAACVWFESMGIGWTIFTDKRCRVLATWALGHDCQERPPLVLEALKHDDGAMAEWLEFTFGQATPADPKHRQDLEAAIDALDRDIEAFPMGTPEEERARRKLDLACKGHELYCRIEAAAGAPRTPERLAAEADVAMLVMQEACRDLADRWFPAALRESASYFENATKSGKDASDGLGYLDRLLAFVRGEID
jgi:hypothetical protein